MRKPQRRADAKRPRTRAELSQAAWDRNFEKLLQFRARFGHCNVSHTWAEDPGLARWVSQSRLKGRHGQLAESRVAALRDIGFDFAVLDSKWTNMLAALEAFRERFGHCRVPKTWSENPSLGLWVRNKRMDRRRGKLSPDRIGALDALGFEWEPSDTRRITAWERRGCQGPRPLRRSERVHVPFDERWRDHFEHLRAYHAQHGSLAELRARAPSLADWVKQQRQRWQRGRLSPSRQRQLETLGVTPESVFDARFEHMFARLEGYKRRFGHCDVPFSWPEDAQLGCWVGHVRALSRRGKLREDREERLRALGVEFAPSETDWMRWYEMLREFRSRFGHCRVPLNWPENRELAIWVHNQRTRGNRGDMRADRKQLLAGLGFSWTPGEDRWEQSFFYAEQFWKAHGHLRVPYHWPPHRTLCIWVSQQRNLKRLGRLRPDREERLRAIGIDFEHHQLDYRFDEHLRELERFKAEHGHCDVPRSQGELGGFVRSMRYRMRKGRLDKERVERLLALGLTPVGGVHPRKRRDPLGGPWQEALEFRRRHGHFAIPESEHPELAAWAARQRSRATRGKIPEEARRELESHGFPLKQSELLWEQRFAAIQAFARRNGHCRLPPESELGRWLEKQRTLAGCGDLDGEREERLAEIGALEEEHRASA